MKIIPAPLATRLPVSVTVYPCSKDTRPVVVAFRNTCGQTHTQIHPAHQVQGVKRMLRHLGNRVLWSRMA